jgi:hypothetical protein
MSYQPVILPSEAPVRYSRGPYIRDNMYPDSTHIDLPEVGMQRVHTIKVQKHGNFVLQVDKLYVQN